MPNFIYLPPYGYLNLDSVVQVFNPDSKTVDLDTGRLVIQFPIPIREGRSSGGSRVEFTGEDMRFVVAALGLASAPGSLEELLRSGTKAVEPTDHTDSIGE